MWKKADRCNYIQDMDRLVNQYNNLTLAAQRCRRDNLGKWTVKEADCYNQAAEICEQIMHMNLDDRTIHAKWNSRKQDCLRMAHEISVIGDSGPYGKPQHGINDEALRNEIVKKLFNSIPSRGFEDLIGMDALKARFLQDTSNRKELADLKKLLHINPVQTYLFYGLPSTGKTAFIHALAHELMNRDENFRFLKLMGGDVHASLVGIAEKNVQIAFREAIDSAPCLFFLDEIEQVCVDRSKENLPGHAHRLTVAFLEAYNMLIQSGKPVIFIAATNHPELVDSAMIDHTALIKFPLPSKSDRAKYFTKSLRYLSLEEGFTIDDIADRTDNYGYPDMHRLSQSILLRIKSGILADFQVFDTDGNPATGKVKLTRALFEEVRKETPLPDRSCFLEKLRSFEEYCVY